MSKVAVVTDSVSCLSPDIIGSLPIRVMPFTVALNGTVYKCGENLDSAEALRLLEDNQGNWRGAASSVGDYAALYRQLSTEADSILGITLAAKFGTHYDIACVARDQVKQELPNINIEILDSETSMMGEGFVTLAAAKAAAEGKGLDEAIEAASKVKEGANVFFYLDTLRHVYRTGRVPKFGAWMGSVLGIKAIGRDKKGEGQFVAAARTKTGGLDRLIKSAVAEICGKPVHMAVMHGAVPDEGEKLKDRVLKEFDCVEIYLTEMSPITIHATGRGALGLAFYTEEPQTE